MPRVAVNGAELNVELLGGDKDAPLIIAHHGAPGLGSMAEPRASFGPLADSYRVLVFDARGSGASSDTPPFTHEQWVADVDALRGWAGAEQVVMAGGSYGGFIAMEYAVRHPERLRALILRDTAADNSHREGSADEVLRSDRIDLPAEMVERVKRGAVRDNEEFFQYWRQVLRIHDAHYDPEKVEARARATPYRYGTHNFAFSTNLPAYDVKDRLNRITCPALVVVGRHDRVTPVVCSEAIAARIPGAELRIFENSGHSPPLEEPEAFQAVVRAFLGRALGGAWPTA